MSDSIKVAALTSEPYIAKFVPAVAERKVIVKDERPYAILGV